MNNLEIIKECITIKNSFERDRKFNALSESFTAYEYNLLRMQLDYAYKFDIESLLIRYPALSE